MKTCIETLKRYLLKIPLEDGSSHESIWEDEKIVKKVSDSVNDFYGENLPSQAEVNAYLNENFPVDQFHQNLQKMKITIYILITVLALYFLAFSWKFILGLCLGGWFGYEFGNLGDSPK